MIKFKIFKNSLTEESWLNSMAQSGYKLKYYSEDYCAYLFEKANKEKLEYKCDYRFIDDDHIKSYKRLFNEFGWEYIKHNVAGEKHIFYRPFESNINNYEIFHEVGGRKELNQQRLRKISTTTVMCFIGALSSIIGRIYFINGRASYVYVTFDILILLFVIYFLVNSCKLMLAIKNR